MKKLKSLIIFNLIFIFTGICIFSQTKTIIQPKFIDAQILKIYGDRCICESELSVFGLFAMQTIWVKIANNRVKATPIKPRISGKIVIEYYDHAGKRNVIIEKPFSNILNETTIKMLTGKVITKIITAKIIVTGLVKDIKKENNSDYIHQCTLVPLY